MITKISTALLTLFAATLFAATAAADTSVNPLWNVDGRGMVPAAGTPVDQLPNPYSGSAGATAPKRHLTACADSKLYEYGTGIYSDGQMDYAAPCLPGGSMRDPARR